MKSDKDPSRTMNLGRRLRGEALADSAAFSPLLHARIMQKIQAQMTDAPARLHWRIGWRVASVAAAVAVLTLPVWLYHHRQNSPAPVAIAKPSAKPIVTPINIPDLAIEFPNLSERANSSFSQARFGYLDRDAKAAADYVINQFNIVPTPPAHRG
jgi:hypothetical protein